jgi:hypothetical protein
MKKGKKKKVAVKTPNELNLQQVAFCKAYVSKEFYGNGTESYIEAYKIDVTKPGAYNGAKSNAYKLLTKTDILSYINELLDAEGLNDGFVDKQLLFIMTQNADLSTKLGGIREYNKLKQRVTDKLDVNHSGSIDQTTNFTITRRKA